jgi:hypothetical protein
MPEMPEIHVAAYFGHVPALQQRLKTDDPNTRAMNGTTPLMSAMFKQQMDCFELLIQHGADPNLCDDDGMDVLSYVMKKDIQPWLLYVLKKGSKPHPQRHRGLLIWAIQHDTMGLVHKILQISPSMVDDVDTEGRTVLHAVIRYRHLISVRDAMVALLLRKGADPLAQDGYGRTPMELVFHHEKNDPLKRQLINAQNAMWLFSVARVLQDTRRAQPWTPIFHDSPTTLPNVVLEHVVCRMNPSLVQELARML